MKIIRISGFWYPAGSDLTIDIDRKISREVIVELRKEGLNVKITSFDGKSHLRLVRNDNGDPATLLEVVRQFWGRCSEPDFTADAMKQGISEHQSSEPRRLSLLCMLKIENLRYVFMKYC